MYQNYENSISNLKCIKIMRILSQRQGQSWFIYLYVLLDSNYFDIPDLVPALDCVIDLYKE